MRYRGEAARYLESSFEVMEPSDLLQWLCAARKSGECRVWRDGSTRRLFFEQGRIVACSSNEPHLLLGQFLIAQGRIDEATLLRCMKLQEAAGRSLGSLLVETGSISRDELQRLVRAKAEETIYGLFDWPQGRFRFEVGRTPAEDTIRVDLDVARVLLEGVRRLDDLRRIRKVLPSMHVVVHRTERAPDGPTVAGPIARRLYESANGTRTLAEIILTCRVSEYEASSSLLRLVERGLLRLGALREVVVDADGATGPVEVLWELVAAGDCDDALELIERHGLRSDPDRELELLIARAETAFLAQAYRSEVPPDAVPVRTASAREDTDRLSSEERFLLDMLEDRWDVRSLSWILPLRKFDLVRGLARLRRGGYIELRPPASAPPASRPAPAMPEPARQH